MLRRFIALGVAICMCLSSTEPLYAQSTTGLVGFSVNALPQPGSMVDPSMPFSPLLLKGIIVNPKKPFDFRFIVDTGRGPQNSSYIEEAAGQSIKYFLAGLTIPEGDLWVNLSPYEKQRMIPQALGQTLLGRDLLAEDYILKQLTASLIYPENGLGKEFWSKVYAQTQKQYGTTNISVNTYNKVWILPDEAQVFEHGASAYVTKSTLKVMLDEDYRALAHHEGQGAHSLASSIVRQIILPQITKEINSGRNFAQLRQIYDALILVKWYKQSIQNQLFDAIYTDKGKIRGVNLANPAIKEDIYERYLRAYKKGVFNFIEDGVTPHKYFSGGLLPVPRVVRNDGAMAAVGADGAMAVMDVELGTKRISDDEVIDFVRQQSKEREDNPDATLSLKYSFLKAAQRFMRHFFTLQFNPLRNGRRPSQYTARGIFQRFNPTKWNFNAPEVDRDQLIGDVTVAGMNVSLVTNISPFAEGQHMLIPERRANLPQYLGQKRYVLMALERMRESTRGNFKMAYNSLGAFSSINQLHFHAFYYGGDEKNQELFNDGKLPIENSDREELFTRQGVRVSRIRQSDTMDVGAYPVRGIVFNSTNGDLNSLADAVFDYVEILNERNVPYNILFTKDGVIVMPRIYQKENRFASGTAMLEMSGEFIVFDENVLRTITEPQMWQELVDTTISQERFDALLGEYRHTLEALDEGRTPLRLIYTDAHSPADINQKITIVKNNVAMADEAVERFIEAIEQARFEGKKPVIGIGTGEHIGLFYQALIRRFKDDLSLDLSDVTVIAQDQYVGIPDENPESYYRFILDGLIDQLLAIDPHRAISKNKFIYFHAQAASPELELQHMADKITQLGGIDWQIIAGGKDGHWAFVFPAIEIKSLQDMQDPPMQKNFRGQNEVVIDMKGVSSNEVMEIAGKVMDIRQETRSHLGAYGEVVADTINYRRVRYNNMLKEAKTPQDQAHWQRMLDQTDDQMRPGIIDELNSLGRRMLEEQKLTIYVEPSETINIEQLNAQLPAQWQGKVVFKNKESFWTEPDKIDDLTLATTLANSRFFDSLNQVYLRAYTLAGILLRAKKIVHVAFKSEMTDALYTMLTSPEITVTNPFSVLTRQYGHYEAIFTENLEEGMRGINHDPKIVNLFDTAFRHQDAALIGASGAEHHIQSKAPEDLGGIDFNRIKLNHAPGSIAIEFDPEQLRSLIADDFQGFSPEIKDWKYISNPLALMGVH